MDIFSIPGAIIGGFIVPFALSFNILHNFLSFSDDVCYSISFMGGIIGVGFSLWWVKNLQGEEELEDSDKPQIKPALIRVPITRKLPFGMEITTQVEASKLADIVEKEIGKKESRLGFLSSLLGLIVDSIQLIAWVIPVILLIIYSIRKYFPQ